MDPDIISEFSAGTADIDAHNSWGLASSEEVFGIVPGAYRSHRDLLPFFQVTCISLLRRMRDTWIAVDKLSLLVVSRFLTQKYASSDRPQWHLYI
jgi:hypothetical protein